MLVQHRQPERDLIGHDGSADTGIERDGIVRAIGCLGPRFQNLGRSDGVELDNAGGRIAAEQRTLRAAQHLDLGEVIDRVRLQYDMFEDDIILDDRNRLRGPEVKIDVAETADVKARKNAPGRGFGIKPRNAARQRQDVLAARLETAQQVTRNDTDRHRHLLQILRPALRGDDDLVEAVGRGRCLLRRDGAGAGQQGGKQRCLQKERRELAMRHDNAP